MATAERIPGVISASEAYTLDEVKARLGIEDRAWWKLRDSGLRFTRIGKGRVILGTDLIRVLGELSECRESESSSSVAPAAKS
jgi:hypothetical protein